MQEVVAELVGARGAELRHPDMAGIQRADQPSDTAALAGRVPTLKQNANGRTQPSADQTAGLQPQRQKPSMRLSDAELALTCAELQMEICGSEGCHADILSGARGKSNDLSFARNRPPRGS